MSRGKELAAQGYIQMSRKYRMVGRRPPGKTGMQALMERDPYLAKHFLAQAEQRATDEYLRCYAERDGNTLNLTDEEFLNFYEAVNGHPTHLD